MENAQYQITYVGSCNEDWNGEVDQKVVERFATIHAFHGDGSFPEGKVELLDDIVLELFDEVNPSEEVFVVLTKKPDYKLDKNTLDKLVTPVIAKKHFKLGAALRRPGGGPTNCAYNTGTLYASMHVTTPIKLVVLEASQYCLGVFNSEIKGRDGSKVVEVYAVRPERDSFSNVNLAVNTHENGEREKFDFTTGESPFETSEISSLENGLRSDKPQMYVVNSVKDRNYSEAIERFLQSINRSVHKFVLAATGSMISKNYDSTFKLMGKSDIYVSNIEELYDLLRGITKKDPESKEEVLVRESKCESWGLQGNWNSLLDDTTDISAIERKVPNKRLIEGIRYIQSQQEKNNGCKGRVYITCGKYGAVAADGNGNIYFQATHPEAVKQAKFLNGAGDSFAATMIGFEAIEVSQPIDRILEYSVAASQIEVRRRGANSEGTLTKSAIEGELQKQQGELYKLVGDSFKLQKERVVSDNV